MAGWNPINQQLNFLWCSPWSNVIQPNCVSSLTSANWVCWCYQLRVWRCICSLPDMLDGGAVEFSSGDDIYDEVGDMLCGLDDKKTEDDVREICDRLFVLMRQWVIKLWCWWSWQMDKVPKSCSTCTVLRSSNNWQNDLPIIRWEDALFRSHQLIN